MMPVLLAFMMSKRTRKMRNTTFLCSLAYWLILAIEAIDLLETVVLEDAHKHIIFTTEAMISIVMILATSYAVITLISYMSPVAGDNKYFEEDEKFDFLYKAIAGSVAVLFCEIPLIVARCRTLAVDLQHILPGTFYVWLIKDIVFVPIILVLIYVQKFGRKYLRLPCKNYDKDTDFHFEPEKRDRYIYKNKRNNLSSSGKDQSKKQNSSPVLTIPRDKKDDAAVQSVVLNNVAQQQQNMNRKSNPKIRTNPQPKLEFVAMKAMQTTSAHVKKEDWSSDDSDSPSIKQCEKYRNGTQKHVVTATGDTSDTGPSTHQKTVTLAGSSPLVKANCDSPSKCNGILHTGKNKESPCSRLKKETEEVGDFTKKRVSFEDSDSSDSGSDTCESPPETHPSYTTDYDKEPPRRVKFKFSIGRGQALAMNSRSDSPGIVIKEETA